MIKKEQLLSECRFTEWFNFQSFCICKSHCNFSSRHWKYKSIDLFAEDRQWSHLNLSKVHNCGMSRCGQLHRFTSRQRLYYWPLSEGDTLSSTFPYSTPQYPYLASRWCASFRFPRFPLTEPCLLTRDLWKRSGVGLPNLSSHTPPNTPLSTPSISASSPISPHPLPLSIQGVESPRWQF